MSVQRPPTEEDLEKIREMQYNHTADKSFIIVLKAMEMHARKAVQNHDPSVGSHVIDGYLQGRLDMIKEVLREYTNG